MTELAEAVLYIQKNIARGIKFLDKNVGRAKWLKKIKENKLDLGDSRSCITGQAFGDFYEFLDKYDMTESQSEKYGFFIDEDGYKTWDLLGAMWFLKIKELKGKK